MRRIFHFLRGYRVDALLGPILKLCEATLELIVPLIIANIIDTGIALGDTGYIVKQCLWLLLLGAAGLAFSVTAQYFCARAAVGVVTGMRSSLFAHIGTLSYTEIDRLGTSSMITRMTSDANQVQTGVNLTLRLLLRSPFVVFGAMIMASAIDPDMAGSFGLTILALSVVVFGIMLISMPLYKRVQRKLDGVVTRTRENLSGARVIRAFCKEKSEIDSFDTESGALMRVQKLVGRISALMNPLTYIIINVAIVLLIHTGAIKVSSGALTAGQVVALYNYMSQILVELIKMANFIITMTKAVASAGRISSVLDISSSMKDGTVSEGAGSEYALELEDAALTYLGASEPSLEGITLKAKKGETIGIIGGTGSGKTSLINLIPRFYDVSSGSVKVDGVDVRDYSIEYLRSRIALVPQKAVLFAGTVRDNMRLGNEGATDGEIIEALKVAQALGVAEEKGGLDGYIEQGGRNLSGGQRQRLTIARALVKKPEILILDDSASALDYATDASLRQAIKNMDTGATVLIVSQRASSIMYADKIIVLDDGTPDGVGTHEELLRSSAVYREIYASQFEGGAV
ncbi:MAG: ABC transporter ATP-binding protein [Clostridia bacterium]|nr:ABC transporter ATP-binding protein [Clostridia bacterium]